MSFFDSDYKNTETKPLTISAFEEAMKMMVEVKRNIEPLFDLLPPPDEFDEGNIVVGHHYVWIIETGDGRKQWVQASPEIVVAVAAEIFRG